MAQRFAYVLTHLPLRLLVRVEIHEWRVPRPLIIAANHRARIDPFLLAALPFAFFRQLAPIHFLTAEHYYAKRWLRPLLGSLGAYPVPRTAWTMEEYFGTSLERLQRGETIMMFPEGRRVAARGPAKPGVAYLAAESGAPVLPVRIERRRIAVGGLFRVDRDERDLERRAEEILDRIYAL